MIIGVPKEIKNHEYRVGMIPASVRELTSHGHQVLVQSQAGAGIGYTNEDYRIAGAQIVSTAKEIYAQAEMIVKVKEPQPDERAMLNEGQILFTYLHLAPDLNQTQDLIKSKAVCIAYETITDCHHKLPLLAPMSEVAGRMSIQAGAFALEKSNGGSGVLLSGVTGVDAAHVVILGGGVVGANAARIAIGHRCHVTILDKNLETLRTLDQEFQGRASLLFASQTNLEKHLYQADLVIGAVLIPGAAAPKLVQREMLQHMKQGSVLVDVAIDQGGCFETSRPTTHDHPTYVVDGIVHYCVANMPGAVAKTASEALNNATLPFVLKLANLGYQEALLSDPHLLNGLNVYRGAVTNREVAQSLGLTYVDPKTRL